MAAIVILKSTSSDDELKLTMVMIYGYKYTLRRQIDRHIVSI